MPLDPRKLIERAAADAAQNGHAQPQVPPLELVLQNSGVDVADVKDQATGETLKLLVVTHASGGFRVVVPLPAANARIIGNLLCDRPNITVP